MRIVLALGSLELGGTESQVCRLAVELRGRGHDVTVLALEGHGPLVGWLAEHAVPMHALKLTPWLPQLPRPVRRPFTLLRHATAAVPLWWWLRRHRPVVVHAFLLEACVAVLPVAWAAAVPVRLCGWRNLGLAEQRSPARRILRWLAVQAATGQTANSRAVADALPGRVAAHRPLAVVPNGLDLPEQVAVPARQPPVGVMVANLIGYKGHLDLVAALALLDHPPHVHCYGEGPQRGLIEAAIRAAGLDDVVVLHGSIQAAGEHFAQAQFAILASHEEGMPNAVLEAMAHGLPVVATRVGGVPELVRHGAEGLLVPPSDPEALAGAITRLAASPELRGRLGAAARRRARTFDWRSCARRYEELYGAA